MFPISIPDSKSRFRDFGSPRFRESAIPQFRDFAILRFRFRNFDFAILISRFLGHYGRTRATPDGLRPHTVHRATRGARKFSLLVSFPCTRESNVLCSRAEQRSHRRPATSVLYRHEARRFAKFDFVFFTSTGSEQSWGTSLRRIFLKCSRRCWTTLASSKRYVPYGLRVLFPLPISRDSSLDWPRTGPSANCMAQFFESCLYDLC